MSMNVILMYGKAIGEWTKETLFRTFVTLPQVSLGVFQGKFDFLHSSLEEESGNVETSSEESSWVQKKEQSLNAQALQLRHLKTQSQPKTLEEDEVGGE